MVRIEKFIKNIRVIITKKEKRIVRLR